MAISGWHAIIRGWVETSLAPLEAIASDPVLPPISSCSPPSQAQDSQATVKQRMGEFSHPLCPSFLVEGFYAQSLSFRGPHEIVLKAEIPTPAFSLYLITKC